MEDFQIIISEEIELKIASDNHGNVTRKEVLECFENHCGKYCYDKREEHLDSDGKPSPWFVSETNKRRSLKIMFVMQDGKIYLKSAYPSTEEVRRIYKKYAK